MSVINFEQLRKYTQARELLVQGVTLRNTLKDMNSVWESLYTVDGKCIIVEQIATKMKAQVVHLYARKLIKYMESIVGLDMVPLSKQDAGTESWKLDCVLLQIASNKVESHEHLFRLLLVNLFGVSDHIVNFAFSPTWENLRAYVLATYAQDLGDVEGLKDEDLTIEFIETAITNHIANDVDGFKIY